MRVLTAKCWIFSLVCNPWLNMMFPRRAQSHSKEGNIVSRVPVELRATQKEGNIVSRVPVLEVVELPSCF